MSKIGIHCPNYPNLTGDDLDGIQALNPSLLIVCQPDFGTIPEIRRRMPGVTIVGRIFGDYAAGWDAWHLPRDPNKLIDYGRFCGRQSEQYSLDITQTRNEPGIDDNDPSWWTVEGYQRLAIESGWVRAGFRQASNRKLGTVPLSPGHQEDDGLLGAQYLAEEWHRHDVLLLHTYWHRGPESVTEEWFGGRWKRQLAAYGWDKPWAITEWNRDEPTPPGDEERQSLAADARRWFAAFPPDPQFLGAAFFIWRTGAPEFQRLQLFNNDELKAVARDVNQAQEDQMPKKTVIEAINTPTGQPGETVEFRFKASGIDGQANGYATFEYPQVPGTTESFYGPPSTVETHNFTDGAWSVQIAIPLNTTPLPGNIMGSLFVEIAELDGSPADPTIDGGKFGPFPIAILPAQAQTPPQPQPAAQPAGQDVSPDDWQNNPDLPAFTELYNAAHTLETNSFPKTADIGRRVIALIDWWKAGVDAPDPFAKSRSKP